MSLSSKELLSIRKILTQHYPTFDDVERICLDLGMGCEISENASISTIWHKILKDITAQNLWDKFGELLKEENVQLPSDLSRSINFDPPKKADDKPNLLFKNHLLLIGIDHYNDGIPTLNNAVRDVQAFKELMLNRYHFSSENCYELLNENASREGIISKLNELKTKLSKEDNLLFYFSGHGDLKQNIGYWLPADATSGKYGTYIANNEIHAHLQGIRTQHTLGIVDACFSGTMFTRASERTVKRYYNIPSRWLMTSGMEEPVPDGLPGYHSPFSESLLTQLEHNYQPALSIYKLFHDIREGVASNSEQKPRCEPLTNSGHQGGEFFFLLKNASFEQIPTTAQIDAKTPLRQVAVTTVVALQSQLRNLVATDDLSEAFAILNDKLNYDSSHKNLVLGRMGAYNGL
ncbi:MAG: caspase domain-containing protein, partial [Saprospiraceae bacterium]